MSEMNFTSDSGNAMDFLNAIPAMHNPNEMQQPALGMAYVPFQNWETPYEGEVGFSRGTIFPSLDKPFIGEESSWRGGK